MKSKRSFAALFSLVISLPALSGTFSRVSCDVSALPSEKRFVAEMLESRVAMRTPPSGRAATLTIRFTLETGIPGENAAVTVKGDCATVAAGRFRGLVQGAGVLLRRIRYGRETFSIDDGVTPFAPKKALRMV